MILAGTSPAYAYEAPPPLPTDPVPQTAPESDSNGPTQQKRVEELLLPLIEGVCRANQSRHRRKQPLLVPGVTVVAAPNRAWKYPMIKLYEKKVRREEERWESLQVRGINPHAPQLRILGRTAVEAGFRFAKREPFPMVIHYKNGKQVEPVDPLKDPQNAFVDALSENLLNPDYEKSVITQEKLDFALSVLAEKTPCSPR